LLPLQSHSTEAPLLCTRWPVFTAELIALVRDDSAAVTRQAVLTLLPRAAELDPRPLLALLQPDNPPCVRLAGYRLLRAGATWQRLATDLRLVDDPDVRLGATARANVAAWLERDAATS
jgi:hypothetical protein